MVFEEVSEADSVDELVSVAVAVSEAVSDSELVDVSVTEPLNVLVGV